MDPLTLYGLNGGPEITHIDVFFYGLFMDVEVLRKAGAEPTNPRRAYVAEFALRIGERATLAPSSGSRAYGMVIAMTHAELERLYGAPSLERYRPETVVAELLEGGSIPALCYNLDREPGPHERNPEYAKRLRDVLAKCGLPVDETQE